MPPSIQPVSSNGRAVNLEAPAAAPSIRQRVRTPVRALNVQAPVTDPTLEAEANEVRVKEKLAPLLASYADANARKNKGTTDEKKAKENLNKAMIEEGVTKFSDKVELNGEVIAYDAEIAEWPSQAVDASEVLKLCGGDLTKFLPLVSITNKAVEDAFGKNALLMVLKDVKKPASLSVSRVK